VRRLTGENGSKVVSYGTEAGQFQAAGYSAVVCGPGNIAQAHQPNEYLTSNNCRRARPSWRAFSTRSWRDKCPSRTVWPN
jgi:acetylornithine deacetylase/succinyl-diaminopimelate desuccinylase-like protein